MSEIPTDHYARGKIGNSDFVRASAIKTAICRRFNKEKSEIPNLLTAPDVVQVLAASLLKCSNWRQGDRGILPTERLRGA
jgi:hypothetical protein